jgi:hypothetical protein
LCIHRLLTATRERSQVGNIRSPSLSIHRLQTSTRERSQVEGKYREPFIVYSQTINGYKRAYSQVEEIYGALHCVFTDYTATREHSQVEEI